MQVKFFEPGKSYLKIKPEIDAEMQRVLAAGDLILRKDVDDFEKNFAQYVGTKYAIGVASGTDALILSLSAAGVGYGDDVLVSSYTFRATIEAIHHVGANPILVDIGERFQNKITVRTKAIIPCHIAGEVIDFPVPDDIIVIEDACQAVGAAPVRGMMACYSFYPAKILGCYGDGGAIATNSETVYKKLIQLRNHDKGNWHDIAYNSRLDNLQAAVLNVKIKYLPEQIALRKKWAQVYDERLENVGKPEPREVYQDYIIHHPYPKQLQKFLADAGIETMLNGYPFPDATPKLPGAQRYEDCTLRIPCHPDLTYQEVNYVCENINEYTRI